MIKVTENEKTESHLMNILGLTIGFDSTEWFDGILVLNYGGTVVASLEGEILQDFIQNDYVKENNIVSK